MSQNRRDFDVNEAEPVYESKTKRNGTGGRSSLPDINITQLIEERNWAALGGLALVAIGILYLVQDILGMDFNLWSLAMLGIGGWLMADAWQRYDRAGRNWVGNSRNRMIGGAVIALIGLFAILDMSGWGFFLLAIGGLLMFDAWQKYDRAGRVWVGNTRSRMIGGGAAALIGAFGLLHTWSTWPLILIIVGVAMLYGHIGGKRII